jgi:hypothetical protein
MLCLGSSPAPMTGCRCQFEAGGSTSSARRVGCSVRSDTGVCDNRSVAERVVIHRLFEKPVEEQAGRA